MRPSTRNAAPNGNSRGPSWTMRTSSTEPMSIPSASTTRECSRSLRFMTASRDVADDVVSGPPLSGRDPDLFLVEADLDVGPDVAHDVEGNAGRIVVVSSGQ